jgi:hypothetical protein
VTHQTGRNEIVYGDVWVVSEQLRRIDERFENSVSQLCWEHLQDIFVG